MAKWPYNTSTWQALRLRKLSLQPLCEVCRKRGVIKPANTVDHIVSIASGGDAFPPLDGLMSMCASCHSDKTIAVDKKHSRNHPHRRKYKGCAADGSPIDPDDPWHGGACKDGKS